MTTGGKRNARQRAARQRRKMILFAFEIIIILVMVAVLYLVMNKTSEGPKVTVMDTEKLAIPSQVQEMKEEGGAMHGYMNIALFGVDAQTDSQLFKDSRSDSTIIASINLDTGDIKLVSVYRDTYLNIGTDEYQKCNGAYSYGGAEQAVKMLNMNLDMDITNFVTVGYKGLSEVIDGLGGVYIDVDSEELKHINNYQVDVSNVLKCEYTPVTEPGYQLLNGVQATAYCRIRQTKGDDFQRAARQREVIQAIEEQAKKMDLATLTAVFNDCIDDIYTSLDSKDILDLIGNIMNYRIVEEEGFPQPDLRGNANMGAKGACVIPTDLQSNVIWLHQFLFEDTAYTVSDSVKEYSQKIISDTSPYME
ncbi:LCP family protein [Acetatifactor aquisgranensis]|uniref:LCP family protein n=1 Tax=Acetatifactor aquisgranensis TaxID=2941233 RepID=UPI00203B2E7B|nr:LCP family protein [Acetatifactor aquisgranensis]